MASAITDTTMYDFFTGDNSPFWYRGYFMEPKAGMADVENTLKLYKVKRILVGHTISSNNIGFHYGGKVLGIDVDHHGGKSEGALYQKGVWYKVDDRGIRNAL